MPARTTADVVGSPEYPGTPRRFRKWGIRLSEVIEPGSTVSYSARKPEWTRVRSQSPCGPAGARAHPVIWLGGSGSGNRDRFPTHSPVFRFWGSQPEKRAEIPRIHPILGANTSKKGRNPTFSSFLRGKTWNRGRNPTSAPYETGDYVPFGPFCVLQRESNDRRGGKRAWSSNRIVCGSAESAGLESRASKGHMARQSKDARLVRQSFIQTLFANERAIIDDTRMPLGTWYETSSCLGTVLEWIPCFRNSASTPDLSLEIVLS